MWTDVRRVVELRKSSPARNGKASFTGGVGWSRLGFRHSESEIRKPVSVRRDAPRGILSTMPNVTQLLQAIGRGERQATEDLLPIVYDELRRLARRKLSSEQPGHTLEATALVHEAYLRLVNDQQAPEWDGRGHFFAAAAEAMRRILIESARRRSRLKRGGDLDRQPLDEHPVTAPEADEELLALDAALAQFAVREPRKAELVKLRYFAGLTQAEAAEALGISDSTAARDWAYAKAWLFRAVSKDRHAAAPWQKTSNHDGNS